MKDSFWEVMDNAGESLYLGYDMLDTWRGYCSDLSEGVRIVKYLRLSPTLLVVDKVWERKNGRMVKVEQGV